MKTEHWYNFASGCSRTMTMLTFETEICLRPTIVFVIFALLLLTKGTYFGTHFIMGGERFDTPQPEAYLFGENADLNFLGSRPTAVCHHQCTTKRSFALSNWCCSFSNASSFHIRHLRLMSLPRR